MTVGADPGTIATATDAVLADHPDALVAAIGADGIFVPMPASVPLTRHAVLRARSALDLVVAADRVVVISAWERAVQSGGAVAYVHLLTDPGTPVVMHFFDARPTHNVFLAVVVAQEGGDVALSRAGFAVGPPRIARVRKNEVAVIVEIDQATSRILGWAADDVVGRRSLELIHPDDQTRAIEAWLDMLETGAAIPVRVRHQHANGSWVWVEITNHNRLRDPEHCDVFSEVIDISDEMAAQEAVRARERLLHRLAESLPIGIIQADPAGRVVYTNRLLHDITGAPAATALVDQLSTVVDQDRLTVEAAVEGVLAGGPDLDLEVEVQRPAGDCRLCTLRFRSVTDDDGAITGALVCVADVTESARLRDELHRRATVDALTGCYNRASVMDALEDTLGGEQRERAAVVFIDLDGFKAVNDRLGHNKGDDLLRTVAERIRRAIRGDDILGRIGGDEFLVLCGAVADAKEALAIGNRISAALGEPVVLDGEAVPVRASVGVAHVGAVERSADELVAEADAAMYQSKRVGAGRAVLIDAR